MNVLDKCKSVPQLCSCDKSVLDCKCGCKSCRPRRSKLRRKRGIETFVPLYTKSCKRCITNNIECTNNFGGSDCDQCTYQGETCTWSERKTSSHSKPVKLNLIDLSNIPEKDPAISEDRYKQPNVQPHLEAAKSPNKRSKSNFQPQNKPTNIQQFMFEFTVPTKKTSMFSCMFHDVCVSDFRLTIHISFLLGIFQVSVNILMLSDK